MARTFAIDPQVMAAVMPNGDRVRLRELGDSNESDLWILPLLRLCDKPYRRRAPDPGVLPGLFKHGLLALYLIECGVSYRDLESMMHRDKAVLHRLVNRTITILSESVSFDDDATNARLIELAESRRIAARGETAESEAA